MRRERTSMKKDVTNRGFSVIHFTDSRGVKCSLQKSSLATEDAIWLGVDYASTTHMHLTKEQASEIIKVLQVFVETGDL